MEWLREWILAIAGTIIIGSLCDMIVPESSIKKYVRLVIGLVLVLAVIGPFTKVSFDEFTSFGEEQTRRRAVEFQNSLGERERFEVIRLYREKLCSSIENEIKAEENENVEVKVEVEENDERRFGEITKVSVILRGESLQDERYSHIKEIVCNKYGVDEENVRIIMLSTA